MVDRSAFAVDENWKNRHKYNISNKQYLLQTYAHAIFNNIWGVLLIADTDIMTRMQRPFTVPLSCNRFSSGVKFYCWWFLLFSIVRHLACWFIAGIVSWHYLQIEKYHRNYLMSLVSEKQFKLGLVEQQNTKSLQTINICWHVSISCPAFCKPCLMSAAMIPSRCTMWYAWTNRNSGSSALVVSYPPFSSRHWKVKSLRSDRVYYQISSGYQYVNRVGSDLNEI